MAINNLSTVLNGIQSIPSFIFPQTSSITSLASRVNWLFRLQIVVATSYCFHKLSQAYQLTYHASFGLNDHSKLIRCKALLQEAQESDGPATLLEECETLVASITTKDSSLVLKKDEILLELIKHKKNYDDSYKIATQISTPIGFKAILIIQEKFPESNLDRLFYKIYLTPLDSSETSLLDHINQSIQFVNKVQALNKALAKIAIELITQNAERELTKLNRIEVFCKIALYYRKIDNEKLRDEFINRALELARNKNKDLTNIEQINAHFLLADTFFLLKKYPTGREQLNAIGIPFDSAIKEENFLIIAKTLDDAPTFLKREQTETHIKKILTKIEQTEKEESLCDLVEGYLIIANIIFKKKIAQNSEELRKEVFKKTLEAIEKLPAETDEDMEKKIEFLYRLGKSYESVPELKENINRLLEGLHILLAAPKTTLSTNAWKSKIKLGYSIFLLTKNPSRYAYYFHNLINGSRCNKNPHEAIILLLDYAKCYIKDTSNPSDNENAIFHKKTCLEAAEELIYKVPYTFREQTAALIAEEYLEFDREKSLEILKNYQKSKRNNQKTERNNCLKKVFIAAIFTGIVNFAHKFDSLRCPLLRP